MFNSSILVSSIVAYILVMACIYFFKPKFFFTDNKETKKYGIGKNESILTIQMFSILLALIIYFVVTIISNMATYKDELCKQRMKFPVGIAYEDRMFV